VKDGARLGPLGLRQGVVEVEELLDAGNLQGRVEAIAHSDQGQGPSFLIMSDVSSDESTDPGGIDIGNAREVDDESGSFLGADGGLELKQSSKHDRALETENSLAGMGSIEIFDGEGFL
jgi:hypothetical protein